MTSEPVAESETYFEKQVVLVVAAQPTVPVFADTRVDEAGTGIALGASEAPAYGNLVIEYMTTPVVHLKNSFATLGRRMGW